uniref:Uncharacterized protein n=1 Tax=Caenorhabditis japonica TaxID=281687 RepID=A0A8R1DY49_CAEJA
MFDYKGVITNITGLAKTTFHKTTNRRGGSGNTGNIASSRKIRSRARDLFRRHLRLSFSEERDSTIIAQEAREDDVYDDDEAQAPRKIVVHRYNIGQMQVEKSVEVPRKKKEKGDKKKKKTAELNIPNRNMFASDFVLRPDEDLPGFSPIDSEYDSDDDLFQASDFRHRQAERQYYSMPPPLMGLNPDIPNEYDPVIGIVAVQGVRIPRSKPIDIVPPKEPRQLLPFFGISSDLHVMLIAERMYDVFKEDVRVNGKAQKMNVMENMASMLSIAQMVVRFVPVELMDGAVYFYHFDTVCFLSKDELVAILSRCEKDDDVAESAPSKFHEESREHVLERNEHYQQLMDLKKIYVRRVDYQQASVDEIDFEFPFIDTSDNEHNKRVTLERQLSNDAMDHEEMGQLIRSISQDLEDAEFQEGFDFIHKSTLSLFDARVMVPPVN